MRIALINPGVPASLRKENLALASLAAAIEAAGHEAAIIDEVAGQHVDASLDKFRPDAAGISFMTMHAVRAYALADHLRETRHIPLIAGGAHPSALPEEACQHFDCVIRGEAEVALPALLHEGRIEGIVDGKPPEDLDALPLPKRELLDLDFYANARDELAGLSYRTLGVITSRGCPYKCTFCVNSKREVPLRFHSPERVIEEVRYLAERHHIESVAFYDELMATDSKRMAAICERMSQTGLNRLKWECQIHPRLVRADLLPLMKQAGCVQVALGFESGSQRVLDAVCKSLTLEQSLDAARLVREAGLRVRGCFIVGAPGETREDISKTGRFIKQARIDFASIHFLTPMPGSRLFDEFADEIAASGIPWDRFTAGDPEAFTCNKSMSAQEVKAVFLELSARQAFRNYSLVDMARRAIREPRQALHVAKRAVFCK